MGLFFFFYWLLHCSEFEGLSCFKKKQQCNVTILLNSKHEKLNTWDCSLKMPTCKRRLGEADATEFRRQRRWTSYTRGDKKRGGNKLHEGAQALFEMTQNLKKNKQKKTWWLATTCLHLFWVNAVFLSPYLESEFASD